MPLQVRKDTVHPKTQRQARESSLLGADPAHQQPRHWPRQPSPAQGLLPESWPGEGVPVREGSAHVVVTALLRGRRHNMPQRGGAEGACQGCSGSRDVRDPRPPAGSRVQPQPVNTAPRVEPQCPSRCAQGTGRSRGRAVGRAADLSQSSRLGGHRDTPDAGPALASAAHWERTLSPAWALSWAGRWGTGLHLGERQTRTGAPGWRHRTPVPLPRCHQPHVPCASS